MTSYPVVIKEEKLEWRFSASVVPLMSNCGACVISGVNLQCVDNLAKATWSGYKPPVKFDLETAFAFLDRNKDTILAPMPKKGFFVLSDAIENFRDFFSSRPEKLDSWLCTSRFVAWLASRKIGAIFRGPICNNPNYTKEEKYDTSGHSIVPWIWVPDVRFLKHAEVEYYINPEWRKDKTETEVRKLIIPKKARTYAVKERAFVEGIVGLDGKKIKRPVAKTKAA